MKEAIIALDGGGSNLRMVVADKETNEELYFRQIKTGTNLSTVPNKEEALENIKSLIVDGHLHVPRDYYLKGIGLSSAGTEIAENKRMLEEALQQVIEMLKISSDRINDFPPKTYVTNDIDVLLHSADIALVAGTGTVGAVKYKDITPYDNTDQQPKEKIYRFDGNGKHIGDKGSGYWIGKEVLTKVSEIENLGGYINSKGEFVEVTESYLRDLVLETLYRENGYSEEETKKAISPYTKPDDAPEFVSLVYSATEANGRPFDRAKVGNLFSSLADKAALAGDNAANDILKAASIELFKNIKAGYEKGGFENKENCNILFSGSVLVHSDIIRYFLETVVKEKYPNTTIKINKEKPVWSTVKYVKSKLEEEMKIEKVVKYEEGMDR